MKTLNLSVSRNWIIPILLLAAGLYLYQIGTESFWIDELYSVYDAKQVPEDISSVRPVYFILLRLWMVLGTSETWLRSLSALFGLGTVFLTYQLGRRVAGVAIGQLAAFMLAVSPLFINHAQEVRLYGLSTLITLAGTLALTDFLERPTLAKIAGWTVARLLAILTTPLNLTFLLPDILLVAWKFRQKRRLLLAVGIGIVVIGGLSLPFTLELLQNAGPKFMGGWITQLSPPSLPEIVGRLTNFTVWWPLHALLRLKPLLWFYTVYTGIAICLFVLSALNLRRFPKLYWVALWGLLPALTILVASYTVGNIWLPRYILSVCPYILILLASGFWIVWQWKQKVAIAIAVVYFMAVSGGLTYYYTMTYRTNFRGIGQYLHQVEQPGDLIGFDMGYRRPHKAIQYYYSGNAPLLNLEGSPQDWQRPPSRLLLVYKFSPHKQYTSEKEFVADLEKTFNIEEQKNFTANVNRVDVKVFLLTPKSTL